MTGIPIEQFGKAYRAVPDATIRNSKHPYGCARVDYSCSRTHRAIMGLVHGLMSPRALGWPNLAFDDNGCGVAWERQTPYAA